MVSNQNSWPSYKEFQVRVKFSAIRTFTIKARNTKEADQLAHCASTTHWGITKQIRQDRHRVLSIKEVKP